MREWVEPCGPSLFPSLLQTQGDKLTSKSYHHHDFSTTVDCALNLSQNSLSSLHCFRWDTLAQQWEESLIQLLPLLTPFGMCRTECQILSAYTTLLLMTWFLAWFFPLSLSQGKSKDSDLSPTGSKATGNINSMRTQQFPGKGNGQTKHQNPNNCSPQEVLL